MNAWILSLTLTTVVMAQIDPELSAYIATRRKLMDDAGRPIADRETVAIELAGALDRAAWSKPDAASRQALWTEARSLLDGFTARNPDHPRSRLFAYQGAVYLWAEGDGWRKLAERNPTDQDAKARAISAFETAVGRLRPLLNSGTPVDDALAQNIRFRLAQSLGEWASLVSERPAATGLRSEAISALSSRPITETGLVGYAELLLADLLSQENRFDEAASAIDGAIKAEVAPSPFEILSTEIPIAGKTDRLVEVRERLKAATLSDSARKRLEVRLRLAERSSMHAGPERDQVERSLFTMLAGMDGENRPEARLSLIEVARTIDEPGPTNEPEAWSLLAQGAAILGQTERAAMLDGAAADRAEAAGNNEKARESRYRAAAMMFQAGRDARAVALLDRLLNDPQAGSLRPRAGMLKALALGRGSAANVPGMTRERYLKSLGDQIARFPDDPTAGEARWLLGRAQLELGERTEAERLWNAIPQSQSRWIDARLAMAALRRAEIEERRLVDRPAEVRPSYQTALDDLDRLAAEARDDSERADVMLERIRLEMLPGLGEPITALSQVDRLRGLPLRPDQRRQADHLRILATMATGNSSEAAALVRNVPKDEPIDSLLGLARELDHLALATEGERASQRVGEVLRLLTDRIEKTRSLDGAPVAEAILRAARARMIAGDEPGGRRVLETLPLSPVPFARDRDRLADLAGALTSLGKPSQAVSVYRILMRLLPDGSPRWFATRLAQARALEADGQKEAARNLIEGTTALYPDLGGPLMKRQYEALTRKLERP